MEIIQLRNYPQHHPLVSSWIYEEFSYSFEGITLEGWRNIVVSGNQDGTMNTLVVLEANQPVATASLDQTDFPPKDHLTPWLASVYTLPSHRGRGLAGMLLTQVELLAKRNGFEHIHLHTSDQTAFYAKRGWTELERLECWGRENIVMVKTL